MAGLLGIFKNSPKNSPRTESSHGLSPVQSALAPVTSKRSVRSHKAESPAPEATAPIHFSFSLESGPLIMYGTPDQSSGALLSGVLDLEVKHTTILETCSLRMIQKTTYMSGSSKRKKENPRNLEVLAQWDILLTHEEFHIGAHEYPFSHLLPGALPPSVVHPLFEIEYYLEAVAVIADRAIPVKLVKPLTIGRSVESVQDKTSMRLFPPTELSLSMVLPSHIFPKASFVSEIRIEKLNGERLPDGRYQRWTVRKVSWSLLESTKVRMPNGEDVEQEDTIYQGTMRNGWKFDPSGVGIAELITRDFSLHKQELHRDVNDSVLHIYVSHKLAVEVLIAEETCQEKTANVGVPTGRARVLRVQFTICVVDAPGLGISWEDEVPPVYADVPLSPPNYTTTLEEIPSMSFSPLMPSMSPTLRHVDPTVGDGSPSIPPSLGESFINRIKQRTIQQDMLRPVQSMPSRVTEGEL